VTVCQLLGIVVVFSCCQHARATRRWRWLWTSSSRAGAEQPVATAWMLLHSTLRTLTLT